MEKGGVVSLQSKKIKVGITALESADGNNVLWQNGIGQNIIFLTMVLKRLELVDYVCIVSCPGGTSHPLATLVGVPVLSIDDAAGQLDVIIELGARGAYPHHLETLKKRGGKIVSYVAGNVMVMNFEELARGVSYGDTVPQFRFDAVWVTPQHWHTCESYLKITRCENTHIVPHIWDPFCVNLAAMQSGRNPHWSGVPEGGYSVGCFDPNVNVVKTFHLPTLVTENAFRLRPDLVSRLLLFSAEHLKSSEHVTQFISALDIGRAGKVFVETRHRLVDVLGPSINAVVAHQWENDLNYLYWEILYFGWPLIHNSKQFQSAGYYYKDFDPIDGGKVMAEALADHARTKQRQASAIRDVLWRFSIENPEVQSAHTNLLLQVLG